MCGQKVKLLIFVYFLLLFKIHYNSFPLEPLSYFVLIQFKFSLGYGLIMWERDNREDGSKREFLFIGEKPVKKVRQSRNSKKKDK